jgi:glycosyltransferase involved in cell wall biosynthesis
MARRNLFHTDASEYERLGLESALKKERLKNDTTKYQSVEEALSSEAVYQVETARDVTRVLFISRDESLLNPDQQSLDGYTNIADLFDEVHILILRPGIMTKTPVLRVGDNVWLYTATHHYWWLTWKAGFDLAENQLVFADGFRPDLIVARDPFESAFLAHLLGQRYKRPVQVHVLENYFSREFKATEGSFLRRLLARYIISRSPSVRTITRALQDSLAKRFKILDLALLPRFNNYEALMKLAPTIDLRDKYKPFVFIMLYIGKLGHDSMFTKALDGARFGLRNPHLGMIVLGTGPAQKEFAERAEMLKIREQVVFEPRVQDIVPYLKSANVLIVPDVTPESEELVLQGAAAGIPMILAKTPIREDIFEDGQSALLCEPAVIDEYSLKLNILMNDLVLRRQLVEAAQDMIRSRFHENPEEYKKAYRESIEQVLFLAELQVVATKESNVPAEGNTK